MGDDTKFYAGGEKIGIGTLAERKGAIFHFVKCTFQTHQGRPDEKLLVEVEREGKGPIILDDCELVQSASPGPLVLRANTIIGDDDPEILTVGETFKQPPA